jgi:hypothetical protein
MTKVIQLVTELQIDVDSGIIKFINKKYNTREQLINCSMSVFNLLEHQLDKNNENITDIQALDKFADMSIFELKLFLSVIYNQIDIGNVGSAVDHLVETIKNI